MVFLTHFDRLLGRAIKGRVQKDKFVYAILFMCYTKAVTDLRRDCACVIFFQYGGRNDKEYR